MRLVDALRCARGDGWNDEVGLSECDGMESVKRLKKIDMEVMRSVLG